MFTDWTPAIRVRAHPLPSPGTLATAPPKMIRRAEAEREVRREVLIRERQRLQQQLFELDQLAEFQEQKTDPRKVLK